MSKKIRFSIIGCGLIGKKRILSLTTQCEVKWLIDKDLGLAEKLAKSVKLHNYSNDWKKALSSNEVDAAIIAVPHNMLFEIALFAIKLNKHVLIEKPGAKNYTELNNLYKISKKSNSIVKVGYNHRFHPAVLMAEKLFNQNKIGELLYIRGRYGHGARIGYEKEWRAFKKISGGGELLDQGSHLIDLSLIFLKDIKKKEAKLRNFFWNMSVEDNAFITLENKKGNISSLHCSWTEWKNLFSFEIFGRTGKLQIEGLGGSYGVETLKFYKMSKQLGPPKLKTFKFLEEDDSWKRELQDFLLCIKKNRKCNSLINSLKVFKTIDELYKKQNNIKKIR